MNRVKVLKYEFQTVLEVSITLLINKDITEIKRLLVVALITIGRSEGMNDNVKLRCTKLITYNFLHNNE